MALALVSSIGLHWAFFQSVAWVGMVITYSQEGTLTQAIVKTFDGKHPCSLCNQIAKAQKSQKKSGSGTFEVKKLGVYQCRSGDRFLRSKPFSTAKRGQLFRAAILRDSSAAASPARLILPMRF
jgi:hypothetical protein